MKKNATYALFGGSFDPPHLGHMAIADALRQLPGIDAILVVPTFKNPFKNSFSAPAKKRLQWCKIVFNKPNIIVSDYEVKQQKAVYTIETLHALSKQYNIQAIVIGADNLKSLQKWHQFELLNSKVKWIIITRKNQILQRSFLRDSMIVELDINVSSTAIRKGQNLEFVDNSIKKQVVKEYNLT